MKNKYQILNRLLLVVALVIWGSFIAYLISIFGERQVGFTQNQGVFQRAFDILDFISTQVKEDLNHSGRWQYILILVIYLIRPILLVPAGFVTTIIGGIYGPYTGALLALIGENLSATSAFYIARLEKINFNIDFNTSRSKVIKSLEKAIEHRPIFWVFVLRAIYVPFDLVNYAAGLSGITWRNFIIGTFWGILPSLVGFAYLGGSLHGGINILWQAGILLLISVILALVFKNKKRPA